MSKPQELIFAELLDQLMRRAGYETPSALAVAAGVQPSTVLRWLSGNNRPTPAALEQIAPVLGVNVAELLAAAYPEHAAPAPEVPAEHPLVRDLAAMLAPDSPLTHAQREILQTMIDHILDPYRRHLREHRAARSKAIRRRLDQVRKRAG